MLGERIACKFSGTRKGDSELTGGGQKPVRYLTRDYKLENAKVCERHILYFNPSKGVMGREKGKSNLFDIEEGRGSGQWGRVSREYRKGRELPANKGGSRGFSSRGKKKRNKA